MQQNPIMQIKVRDLSRSFIKMFNSFPQVSTVSNTETPKVISLGISYHWCDTVTSPCVYCHMSGIVSTFRNLVQSVSLPNGLHKCSY